MQSQTLNCDLVLRDACPSDLMLLWQWRNDPMVRAMSFSSEAITLIQHEDWFARKLADTNCFLFIIQENFQPIGQIRFEGEYDFEVSFSLSEQMRGKKYATPSIILGIQTLCDRTNVQSINAYIRPDNYASVRAFGRSGFILVGKMELKGVLASHYQLIETSHLTHK
jgi:UDP-2,4-diacetamido-2,4,6-trideoxy-beta-L-altropyranose hydrolase